MALAVVRRLAASNIDLVATGRYFSEMRQIGIKALKNELSQHIRAVRSGETIAVTDRGHVVAEITPPRRAVADGEDAILADHARRGLVRMATAGKGEPPPRRLSTVPFDQLMNDLDESRSDR